MWKPTARRSHKPSNATGMRVDIAMHPRRCRSRNLRPSHSFRSLHPRKPGRSLDPHRETILVKSVSFHHRASRIDKCSVPFTHEDKNVEMRHLTPEKPPEKICCLTAISLGLPRCHAVLAYFFDSHSSPITRKNSPAFPASCLKTGCNRESTITANRFQKCESVYSDPRHHSIP